MQENPDFYQPLNNGYAEAKDMNTENPGFELQDIAGGRVLVRSDQRSIFVDGKLVCSLTEIVEVNLSLVVASKYNPEHFLCRIWLQDGSSQAFRAVTTDQQCCNDYREFLLGLHSNLVAQRRALKFTSGMRSRGGYRAIRFGFWVTFAGLFGLVVFAISQRGKLLLGIGFLGLIMAAGYFFDRMIRMLLRPSAYDPTQIPANLLPTM